ncbi:hypothetical protein GGI16_004758, partial [Coemansia sp. S142-1]
PSATIWLRCKRMLSTLASCRPSTRCQCRRTSRQPRIPTATAWRRRPQCRPRHTLQSTTPSNTCTRRLLACPCLCSLRHARQLQCLRTCKTRTT